MKLSTLPDKIVFNILKDIEFGYLELLNHDGKQFKFGNPNDSLKAKIIIKKSNFTFDLIRGGSVGLAESYMKNDFETDNLSNLIEITARNIMQIYKFSGLLDFPLINYVKNFLIRNTKSRSKENISKHYDLGNEFFSLWLDKTLTYSSAIFDEQNKDLSNAQNNKYQKLIDLIKPNNGDKILEIGCGWGGFAEYLGKKYDVKLDCITISKKQFEYAKKRIHECGLNEKVNIEIKDYRDLRDKYNSIASIEMIEAVGQNYLESYFKTIKNNLSNDGRAAIQAITIDDNIFDRYKTKKDFIQKYIFPGGFLPSVSFMEKLIKKNDLKLEKINSYSDDYARTLATWRENFLSAWDKIRPLGFDEYFKRMWEFYLSYCEGGFRSRNINLIQLSMSNRY